MLYETLKKRKQELGLTNEQLSRLSGVALGTVNKILNGDTKSPRYDTVQALEAVLYPDKNQPDMICEAALPYLTRKQGEYTLDDYHTLPDDVRAELIDGHLIFLEAPTFKHQELTGLLCFKIQAFIFANKGKCKVLPAPLDVQLDCDDKTIVQPDIVVSCRKDRRSQKGIYGAPDMCIEIVSPASRKTDYGIKLSKYMNAGVREYWIVDLKHETVVCYYFEEEVHPILYTFNDRVPVHIFGSELEIDFAEIKEMLDE